MILASGRRCKALSEPSDTLTVARLYRYPYIASLSPVLVTPVVHGQGRGAVGGVGGRGRYVGLLEAIRASADADALSLSVSHLLLGMRAGAAAGGRED